ncbi:hypothetical protein BDP27DRAFT_508499 [Rhodocollybia butyracea]|uniref:Uncharacterized protein n=1 Tax=Rhodocollybia butyracea TaxID=206335 RepID=A0A9P5P9C0_9AGAR|nr:hypothetical protein BDP27DRAFT_508499 [Rhodocollybia butyracea]
MLKGSIFPCHMILFFPILQLGSSISRVRTIRSGRRPLRNVRKASTDSATDSLRPAIPRPKYPRAQHQQPSSRILIPQKIISCVHLEYQFQFPIVSPKSGGEDYCGNWTRFVFLDLLDN